MAVSGITENSKIVFHWKVTPYDFSKEKCSEIITKASKKYSIPKDRIKIVPDFIMIDKDGTELSINKDVVQNIQDPNFQLGLFKEYLSLNNIEDYDFEYIKTIDAEINASIDYKVYDKYRRYSIKWVRWDNFLSYGSDNFFDFSNLNGIVLLSGTPSNQSGKTTFGIDLIHFLLFGHTDKADVQSKIFNKHIPEATSVVVEGCINIEGEDFIIKRTLTRPQFSKRTSKSKVTQKVEYYKIVGDSTEELEEYVEDQNEENTAKTNKVIKEAIGTESDFDLVMSVTESNLDALIEKKESERGRLLSRWIGLLPLEEKDAIARAHYNEFIKPNLYSNIYDLETAKNNADECRKSLEDCDKEIKRCKSEMEDAEKDIASFQETYRILVESKQKVNDEIMNLDSETLKRRIETTKSDGVAKKLKVEEIDERIKEIGDVDFSVEEYDKENETLSTLKSRRAVLLEQHASTVKMIDSLKNSEICPVCKRKLENVDNSEGIRSNEELLTKIINEGKEVGIEIAATESKIASMKSNRDLYNEKSKLTMSKAAFELSMAKLRESLITDMNLLKEYEANSNAIDKNNEIDIKIRNNDVRLKDAMSRKDMNSNTIISLNAKKENTSKRLAECEDIISKIEIEREVVKNWKIYLDMVGRNGVSKMVLRRTLPIINAKVSQMLDGVCDFNVEVGINDKNDVMFYIIKDGVVSDLTSGSGFERTAASLALRSVLSDISTIPRNSFILLDEITGRVSSENLENIHSLIDRISKSYAFIFIITHLSEVKDWANTNVIVTKENNISKISVAKK